MMLDDFPAVGGMVWMVWTPYGSENRIRKQRAGNSIGMQGASVPGYLQHRPRLRCGWSKWGTWSSGTGISFAGYGDGWCLFASLCIVIQHWAKTASWTYENQAPEKQGSSSCPNSSPSWQPEFCLTAGALFGSEVLELKPFDVLYTFATCQIWPPTLKTYIPFSSYIVLKCR